MKFLKSRLLLTVLSPLVLSLSGGQIANAGSSTYNFRNGNYINLTCSINSDNSKVVTTTGKLGNIISHGLRIEADRNRIIKRKLPVDQNGNFNYTKTLSRKKVQYVFIIGLIEYPDAIHTTLTYTACS